VVVVKFKVVSVNLRSFVICGKSQVFFKFGSFNWIIAKFEFFLESCGLQIYFSKIFNFHW
jgi:hypothetical protein